jgi:hypothetical protein
MTRKIYRTAQGKMVDIGALQLRNENVRAVGNMAVNARGDLIDSNNQAIEARSQQVAKSYKKQTTNVSDSNIYPVKQQEPKKTKKSKTAVMAPSPAAEIQPAPPDPVPAAPVAAKTADRPLTGLAAAIAKARQIKQEELTNPRDVAIHQQRRTES